MYPTLNVIQNTSDVVYIMHQNVYRRGDIVVLHKNNIQSSKDAIKRIIAVGGETVAIKQDHDGFYRVFINNEALDESYISSLNDMKKCYEHFQTYLKNHNIISDYITLEENEIFVLGDNRASSYDSSSYGARTINEIEGKVVFVVPHFYNFLKSLFA